MTVTERQSWAEARTSFRDQQRLGIAMAALELLLEAGSAELTMSMVADRAGISRQTLYRYFPDLGAVLTATTEGLVQADQAMRAWVLEGDSPSDRLGRVIDALVEASQSHGGSTEEFIAALPPEAREAVRAHHSRTRQLVEDVLEALVADPSVTYDGDPRTDAPLFLGLITAAGEETRQRTHDLINQLIT